MSPPSPGQRMALGTAQFGLDYGITNQLGRIDDQAARALLAQWRDRGWHLLDTAGGYGNSEERLGIFLQPHLDHGWQVMTKTPAVAGDRVKPSDITAFDAAWKASRMRMGEAAAPMHALLVHRADDLLMPGGEALHALLCELRERAEVTHIGASVYDSQQLDALFSRYGGQKRPFDIIQFPASIADQRLARHPLLVQLHRMSVQLHVRSLYLQGLLLAHPQFVEQKFPGKGIWLERMRAWSAAQGLDPVQACMSFFRSSPILNVAVVGMTSPGEFVQLAHAWDTAPILDWREWADDDVTWVDPRNWNK